MKKSFVPVCLEIEAIQSQKDAEGDFFRRTFGRDYDSTGYKLCSSASGVRLPCDNWQPDLQAALREFQALPETDRKPIVGEPASVDARRASHAPPPGGLILKNYVRVLSRGTDGRAVAARRQEFPKIGDDLSMFLEASPNFAWLTEKEWKSLVPENPKKGDRRPVADGITRRLCRYHLVPFHTYTFGRWSPESVRAAELTLLVEEVTEQKLTLRLDGYAHLGSVYEAEKATSPNGPLAKGYEADLQGIVEYDRARNAFTRFDVVALGDVWGRLDDCNGDSVQVERPGRNPIGVAFELVSGKETWNHFVPCGESRFTKPEGEYWR